MIKFRLYIPPVILGFVIVPLLVWPTVIVLAVLIFTLTFLAEIIFSFPLLQCNGWHRLAILPQNAS